MRDGKFYHYASLADFARGCMSRGTVENDVKTEWAGGTGADAVRFCLRGDMSRVADAERLVGNLDAEIESEGVRPMWMPSVVGSFPLVPAYLAGTPEAMMARTDVPDPRGDIEIWACTTVSANCSASGMMRRGVVTLAFAMALSRVRNVSLVLYSTISHSNVAIRLSSPLDFSEACAAFCQPAVTRQLVYGHAKPDGFNGKWSAWAEARYGGEAECRALMECAGMPADALRLGTERLGDYSRTPDAELVKILNDKVREYARS